MKAIVLGATGFIGSHVARALVKEGIDVRVLSRSGRSSKALEGLKVEMVTGDLEDKSSLLKAFQGCDTLFHVAGYYPLYSLNPEPQKIIALRQMAHVLEAALESKFSKVVYTSSLSTIGKNLNGLADEKTPYDTNYFRGLYYEIKYLQEQQTLDAVKRGLPLTIVNPTAVFGDYDIKPTSGSVIVAIVKRQLPLLIDAKMNMIDGHNVGLGQVAAMKKGRVGERYILGDHNLTVWEMAQIVARTAKVSPPKGKIPLFVAEGMAYVSEVVGKILRQEKPLMPLVGIDFLKYGMHYDSSKARKELDLPSTPVEETFDRTISWFRRNGYL